MYIAKFKMLVKHLLVSKAGDVEEFAADLKFCSIFLSVEELEFDFEIIYIKRPGQTVSCSAS
jgi:hypothetical protein